ncbi:MAG: transposase, partial [Gammaproteobacteria bacterium]
RQPAPELVHHSDRGQTYAASTYRGRLKQLGMHASMSRKGNCWDNAVAESFFATVEFELIERRVFASRTQARSAIFEFIEVFYNRQRAHQTLGYKTPLQMEQEYRLVA